MSQNYKLWVKTPQQIDEYTLLPSGIYDVLDDNGSYDKTPDVALIKVGDVEHWLHFSVFGITDSVEWLDKCIFAMNDVFELGVLDFSGLTDDDKENALEGLRPHFLSVDEYVNGTDDKYNDLEHAGYKSVDDALLAATVHDYRQSFITRKRLDEILVQTVSI